MEQQEKVTTEIINSRQYLIFICLYLILSTLVTFFAYVKYMYYPIAFGGLFIFWFSPLLFQKKFRRPFIKKAVLNMDRESFVLHVYNVKTGELEKEYNLRFEDILSFRAIDSSKDDSFFLKFVLKNESKCSFTFLGQGKINSNQDISDLVFRYIRSYNEGRDELGKITLSPNLFATRFGQFLIRALVLLLLLSILWQLDKRPGYIPISLFLGLSLYLIILGQRRNDMVMTKRLE